MASKNIKGITIEIGGNTTKLQDALKGVDKSIYSLNSDLKNLNQALKLDPSNTSLLAQKMDVLKRNISELIQRISSRSPPTRTSPAASESASSALLRPPSVSWTASRTTAPS